MKSKFLKLNKKDFIKGAIVAILMSIATTATLDLTIKQICLTSFYAFCGYLAKNILTNSNDKFLKTE